MTLCAVTPNPRLRLLGLLLLGACAAAPARPDSIEPLVGSWQLAAAVPAGARIPTMSIARSGAVSGNAGVNRFTSQIDVGQLAAGHFQIAGGAATKMAGPPEAMQLEASFRQSLAAADAVKVNADTLLLLQGERPLIEFRRVAGR